MIRPLMMYCMIATMTLMNVRPTKIMLQQHHADDDAADLADAADERDAADDAGRDGVQLIVQAGSWP